MGYPVPYAGLIPKLLITATFYMAAVRRFGRFLLQSVGLITRRPADGSDSELWYLPADHRMQAMNLTVTSLRSCSCAEAILQDLRRPILSFSLIGDHDYQEGQCAVCLSDFDGRQEVRQLPNCCHVFHEECIQKWVLHEQRTCPLCRSSLVSEEVAHELKTLAEPYDL